MEVSFLKINTIIPAKSIRHDIKQLDKSNKKTKNPIKANSKQETKYVLEGGVIRVYITDEDGSEKCVKTIPLSGAPLHILLKLKPTSMADAIFLNEMIETKRNKKATFTNYNNCGELKD